MGILKFFGKVIMVIVAALAGNWAGERWRALETNQSGHELTLFHSDEQGEMVLAINPLFTNFLPAVYVGLLSRPGWLFAFVVGALTARIMGDQYEDQFIQAMSQMLPGRKSNE